VVPLAALGPPWIVVGLLGSVLTTNPNVSSNKGRFVRISYTRRPALRGTQARQTALIRVL
jgi:hypothetical protein